MHVLYDTAALVQLKNRSAPYVSSMSAILSINQRDDANEEKPKNIPAVKLVSGIVQFAGVFRFREFERSTNVIPENVIPEGSSISLFPLTERKRP